ncbi:MAG: hypothetical protein E1N59_381 [Puniceicoccaceae bacterium 5H]|nr:MAG: hypothetical protein E1N59_381 [Puniceicoccaceae bacterium 5H]
MKTLCFLRRKTGSIYVLILFMSAAFGLLVYSMLSYQNSELMNNYSYTLQKQAQLANESLFFLACEQLKETYDNNTAALQPGSTVSIDIPEDQLRAMLPLDLHADWDFENTEVHVGSLSDWTERYIGSDVPGSENSQFLDQTFSYRSVPVMTKVTLTGPKGSKAVSYARCTFGVKAAPITSFAIFYNQNLESYAGNDFLVDGRVHTNGDLILAPENGGGKAHIYLGRVSSAGQMRLFDRGHNMDNPFPIGFNTGLEVNGSPQIMGLSQSSITRNLQGSSYYVSRFDSGDYSFSELQNGSADYDGYPYRAWMDKFYSEQDKNWYQLALDNWNGMLKTGVHDVQKITIPGMDRYEIPTVTDRPYEQNSAFKWDPQSDDYWNTSYQMIQPLRSADDPAFDSTNTEASANLTREHNKLSYNAGLIIEIDGSSGHGYDLDPYSVTFDAYYYKRNAAGQVLYNADGTPQKVSVGDPRQLGIVEVEPYQENAYDNSLVETGMYDNRRGESVNFVKLDVDRLRELVDDYDSGAAATDKFSEDPVGADLANGWWNGSVYVQFPYADDNPRLSGNHSGVSHDGVQPSVKNYGLYVYNGEEIPEKGLTVSTNNVMYLVGNFNADGNLNTGSTTEPEDAGEPPAAVAADAVILLSSNWIPGQLNKLSKKNATERNPKATEYSAAIIAGNSPLGRITSSGQRVDDSGSVANFIRFYEDWSDTWGRYPGTTAGATQAMIRGSIICLFDSEVAEEKWSYGGNRYTAPARLWGYNSLFEKQTPPGIPLGGFSGPGSFQEVDRADWDEAVAAL